MVLGANPAVHMYSTGPAFARLIHDLGTDEQKQWARVWAQQRWGATMVLTEPDAGSDVGAGRTTASQQPDGSWHITGVKRFITSGEHDMTDNIIHLVLARPEGAGPGTKGLSLFIVPKFHVDWTSGQLRERNGVYATNLEHKMGLKASATCELTFGEREPAVGWLVGDVHDGIAQMFKVIEYARMLVGTKAIATLSAGYLNALEYTKTRVQGPDLTQASDKTAPRVTVIHHPDVRRSLMTQKAYSEGLRALMLYAASVQDAVEVKEASGEDAAADHALNDLLLPIVKGVRVGEVVRVARGVAAVLRRLRLPAGLPDRAVHPRREDRHPLRRDDRDPGAGPLLPQDGQATSSGAITSLGRRSVLSR